MRFSAQEVDRYARHLVLREIGGPGQQKLKAASVLIVGLGGLGSPAALYLAAAGVGRLGLVDADAVALSNLQRQILFKEQDVGALKVETARCSLGALNANIDLVPHPEWLDDKNGAELVRGYDIVLDGTDSFHSRYDVNAACLASGKPLISGAIGRWSGQLAIFNGRPCYRCLVPTVPPDIETCSEVGVVGALAGVVGSMMALEAIKLICGAGQPLIGRLWVFDALAGESRTLTLAADPACPICGGG